MAAPSIIAIDGPAASGKTTLGHVLAQQLGYLYFDTGAMYRAVTLLALEGGIDTANEAGVVAVADAVSLDVVAPEVDDGRPYTVLADGRDVTWKLRGPEVDANVSQVSAYPGVRKALTEQQRRIGLRGRVVMIGRDIGTVVLPEADLKLYFDASVEVRARRRWKENQARGQEESYEDILEAMRRRDQFDARREYAPMRPAEDAVRIDTSEATIEEVIERVQAYLAISSENKAG